MNEFKSVRSRYLIKKLFKFILIPIFLLAGITWLYLTYDNGEYPWYIDLLGIYGISIFIYLLICCNLDFKKTEVLYDRLYRKILLEKGLAFAFPGKYQFNSDSGIPMNFYSDNLGVEVSRRFVSNSYARVDFGGRICQMAYIKDWKNEGLHRNMGIYLPLYSGMVYAFDELKRDLPDTTMALGDISFVIRGQETNFAGPALKCMETKIFTQDIPALQSYATPQFQEKLSKLCQDFAIKKMIISFHQGQVIIYISDANSILRPRTFLRPDQISPDQIAQELTIIGRLYETIYS